MTRFTADEVEVLRLDSTWNDAYQRHDRSALANVLADDFIGYAASDEPISKPMLMVDPPEQAKSIAFSEQSVRAFGDTAISRGRLRLELDERRIDQRFLRVFAKRDGAWRAVSVAVTPLAPET